MTKPCNCDRFEYLTGAATRIYVTDFLEPTGTDELTGSVHYRCRICGTAWKSKVSRGTKTPRLTRLPKSALA